MKAGLQGQDSGKQRKEIWRIKTIDLFFFRSNFKLIFTAGTARAFVVTSTQNHWIMPILTP